MDDELLMFGLVVLGSIVAVITTAIVAFFRTTRHRREIEELQQKLNATVDRLGVLEQWAARRMKETRVERPEPTPAPRPAEEPVVPVKEPPPPPSPKPVPPVVEPPPVIEPPPIKDPGEPPPVSEPPRELVQRPAAVVYSPAIEEAPAQPNPVLAWLLQGNPLAKLGVFLLFIGLGFLLKFANDRNMLPIELRLSAAAVIATGLLVVGWRLRHHKPVYALTLQGGSIGALYLTSFAAFRVYSLLPHSVVFGLLVVICAASVALAVLQNAQSLALLASLGGYLAPIVLSTGGGHHVALFSYYALLSAGILFISVWKAWRPVNLIGFAFTFGIGAAWGAEHYQPAHYASVQAFLILNLLLYGVIAVLMALRHNESTQGAIVDGTLAFGTPLIGFGLQVAITREWEYGPAFSALGFGALYLPLAFFTMRRWPERGRRLTIAFLALGAGFVTLAIPLALSARWTAMAWALEGLGVLWAGRSQNNKRMTWSGTSLLGIAAASAFMAWQDGVDNPTFFMLAATLSLSWLAAARMWLRMEDSEANEGVSLALLVGSMIVWLILVVGGSNRVYGDTGEALMLILGWMSASALVWFVLGRRLNWTALSQSALLLWPTASAVLPLQMFVDQHPLGTGWWSAGWLVAVGTMWQLLRLSRSTPDRAGLPIQHGWFVWIAFALSSLELLWRLDSHGWGAEEWPIAGLLTLCAIFVLLVSIMSRRGHWAVAQYPKTYWIGALTPVGVTAFVLLLRANVLDGRVPELPYIPLLNILEEPAAFMLLMAGVWYYGLRRLALPAASFARDVTLAFVIYWANGVLLRTLAMIGGVGWTFDALWASAFIQTSMALAWTVAALICMALAARSGKRPVWFAGAVGLGAVVVKLFMVDSANQSGLARAIAFIGVALLVLIIGYLAPLPPRQERTTQMDGGTS
jgi:uncharacterized membrane protein